MDDHGGGKVNGIRQIVRLKEILHKWHLATMGQKAGQNKSSKPSSPGGISPAISKRLKGCSVYVDLDEDNCQSPDPPHDVPKGYLAVYVGPELRRFIIPTSYLSDPLFKVLLEKVEEEFGFDHSGGLTIPCETETFKYLLQCMENHQKEPGVDDKNHQKEPGVHDKNHEKKHDVDDKNHQKEHDADDKNHEKEHDVRDKAEKSLGNKD